MYNILRVFLLIQLGCLFIIAQEKPIAFSGVKIIDAKGKVIMPGFVDAHIHIGLDWGFDSDSPAQPDIRILDAINPNHDFFNRARAGGITIVNIMHSLRITLKSNMSYFPNVID